MDIRYKKNIGDAFTEELQNICLTKTVAVIGAGGCGGYILEHLARIGVKKIIIFDGDNFELSNINRQRFCDSSTIGMNKARVAKEAIEAINEEIDIVAIEDFFSDEYVDIISSNNVDVVFHAADPNANVRGLYKGLDLCLLRRIPVIRAGIRVFDAIAVFIEPTHLEPWFEIKMNAIRQASEGYIADAVSNLSHYNALSANFVLELFLAYLRNPKMTSCFFTYNYNTMQTNLKKY